MKQSLLIVALAGLTVSAGAWLFAQSPKTTRPAQSLRNSPSAPAQSVGSPNPQPSQPPAQPPQPTAKPEEFASSPTLKTTTVEAINLRNQYIELCKKKALLMKEPQLKHEIETLERQIPELEAWAKAEEAVQLLREVIEKHPNTKAAKSARAAIQLIEGRGEDNFFEREDSFEPRPDGGTKRRFDDPRPVPDPQFDGSRRATPSAPHDAGPSFNDSRRARPSVPAPTDRDFQPGPDRDRLSS